MRPALARHMRSTAMTALPGRYSEQLMVTVDEYGQPIATSFAPETATRVRDEPADPPDPVLFPTATEVRDERADEISVRLDTFTEVRDERADEPDSWAETFTKVRDEPTDEPGMHAWVTPADDCVTGVVAF